MRDHDAPSGLVAEQHQENDQAQENCRGEGGIDQEMAESVQTSPHRKWPFTRRKLQRLPERAVTRVPRSETRELTRPGMKKDQGSSVLDGWLAWP